MYFELTRRNYISLFKKLIMNNTELLEKLNIKMLQIIIAKELKIEEILNSVDMEMGSEVIEKYFLDSFCYEKKSRIEFDLKRLSTRFSTRSERDQKSKF